MFDASLNRDRLAADVAAVLHPFERYQGDGFVRTIDRRAVIGGGGDDGEDAASGGDDLIAAYRQMIELAHQRGVQVIGCTITPYGGSSAFRERGEQIRVAVNDWIRNSGAFDAVIDFDGATRDAADPHKFRAAADSPDLLHPGDAGYKLMAAAVDLRIFQRVRAGVR